MPMNGNMMAAEVLAAMGGMQTKDRILAFQRMCDAIVRHIQLNATVTVQNVQAGVNTVITPGPGAVL
jgi:hypothetical protein